MVGVERRAGVAAIGGVVLPRLISGNATMKKV